MLNRLTAIILTCAIFVAPALSQQRRQGKPPARPASAPAKVTTQTATTRDGKIVLLHSDGTWEYSDDNPSTSAGSQPTAAAQAASLNIEAGLVYRSGDSKPVARTDYYLLDKSAAAVIREAGIKLSDNSSGTEDNSDHGIMFSRPEHGLQGGH